MDEGHDRVGFTEGRLVGTGRWPCGRADKVFSKSAHIGFPLWRVWDHTSSQGGSSHRYPVAGSRSGGRRPSVLLCDLPAIDPVGWQAGVALRYEARVGSWEEAAGSRDRATRLRGGRVGTDRVRRGRPPPPYSAVAILGRRVRGANYCNMKTLCANRACLPAGRFVSQRKFPLGSFWLRAAGHRLPAAAGRQIRSVSQRRSKTCSLMPVACSLIAAGAGRLGCGQDAPERLQ